ncbi:restriction endonuclease [Streptomyces sp. LaPpAH-108]|uniref:restriction endonuclease n=1 Tax=Streptomyces sp. LaPpAH-108 TaxID=1155714 RepID=UPI0003A66A43|nr:restriction endonuclease [Streptomyces sp. LaPpAH-108]
MGRRSAGLAGVWAEAQRQEQRRRADEARRERERERQERAREREVAQSQREFRQAQARRRTEELEARVAALRGLLAAGCGAQAFRVARLMRSEEVEPFDPGPLGWPVRMPDRAQYRAARGGWTAAQRAQAEADAQTRFEHDWFAAQAAESRRLLQLAVHQREYEQRVAAWLAEVRRHNAGVAEAAESVRRGEPEAVVAYFGAALRASTAWPGGFPCVPRAAYDPVARQLVLDWELPGFAVVPEARSVRYMPTLDQEKETPRPMGQRRTLYREVLAQCLLLAAQQVFAADEFDALDSVAVNGVVDDHDPATGRQTLICLATVMAPKATFTGLHLAQVDPVSCLTEALKGRLSARPDQLVAVRPGRRPEEVRTGPDERGSTGEEPDLYAMDPVAFESLVAELFRAMGMEAVTTARSGDGGVDVHAVDPAPIRGGQIVVQVKRYRNTVPPTAVRDLYGTVQDTGANKGVLVTTSGFGPGSHTFAQGKPLELISGPELVDLLHRHGLRGRLGEREGRPAAETPLGDYNVLGMSWSGEVALDMCALVCAGARVLGDDHFVFFNNPATPDGSVRSVPAPPPDKAAVRVSFDALPAEADRLVLVAAVDPETDPHADLSGFTAPVIRLLDPALTELGRLEVSEGRPGETALVLGSFRRRPTGDWDFVLGGRGYPGGLAELLADHGIAVE